MTGNNEIGNPPVGKTMVPLNPITQANKGTTSTSTSTSTNNPTVTDTTPNEQVSTGNQAPTGSLSFAQVENIWIQAGGNPQAAQMAAAIADASSGLNTGATVTNPDGTQSVGLWLIPVNGQPPGSTDPLANARAAVQMSGNGQDWSTWCTAWSDNDCGCQGGSYLGQGANALSALMGQSGSYNVAGSAPTGTGTGASTATTSTTSPSTSTTSSTSKYLIIAVLLVLVVAVFIMVRRHTQGGSGGSGEAADNPESRGRSQESWTPAEEAMLSEKGRSDKELSSELGRSVRSIRVRRNQMKSR